MENLKNQLIECKKELEGLTKYMLWRIYLRECNRILDNMDEIKEEAIKDNINMFKWYIRRFS